MGTFLRAEQSDHYTGAQEVKPSLHEQSIQCGPHSYITHSSKCFEWFDMQSHIESISQISAPNLILIKKF